MSGGGFVRVENNGGDVVLVRGFDGAEKSRTPLEPKHARALAAQLVEAADEVEAAQ